MKKSAIFEQPNQYSRPARLELLPDTAIIHGYQEYVLTHDALDVLPQDPPLQKKKDLLIPYFRQGLFSQRSFLDLGANGGFFTFWALQAGIGKATALDLDETYLDIIQTAGTHLGFTNLEIKKANVADWNQPADIVCALALIHWIYSCTAVMGSLSNAVGYLGALTRSMLIIEWISPDDPAIQFFHHLDWNKEHIHEPYTLEAFESALHAHFPRIEIAGLTSPTRKLYICFKTRHIVDLSGPLPFLGGQKKIISCRMLSVCEEIPYWSCVYNDPLNELIVKQGTLTLGTREYLFLSELDSPYFPKVFAHHIRDGYSFFTMEKIQGDLLDMAVPFLRSSFTSMLSFFLECLNILADLKEKGILHRDIKSDNIIVRGGKPVLFDFGWAISENSPFYTPEGLGVDGRPPDGNFCDVFSMGKVFEQVNQHTYPVFDPIIDLMTEADVSFRITDIELLIHIFNSLSISILPETENRFFYRMINEIYKRNRKITELRLEKQFFVNQKREWEETKQKLHLITSSRSWKVAQYIQEFRNRLAPAGSLREKLLLSIFNKK